MNFWTHRNASTWSAIPAFPGISSVPNDKYPDINSLINHEIWFLNYPLYQVRQDDIE